MKKCVIIAPLVSHATAGRVAALLSTGMEVSLIDISGRRIDSDVVNIAPYSKLKQIHYLDITSLDPFYRVPTIGERIKDVLRSYGFLQENPAICTKIQEILSQEKPDVVVGFYGPLGIHMLRLVKKVSPKTKTVFIPNLVPSTILDGNPLIKFLKKRLINEFVDYTNWIRKIDFIFCASKEMQDFIHRKFKYPVEKMRIIPDFHPAAFKAASLQQEVSDSKTGLKGLIFLGAPERWGGKIDNLDGQLNALVDGGIPVHTSSSLSGGNVTWGTYPYFSDKDVFEGKLSDYAHEFDAALVTYNISKRSERFRSTLPTRFFSALAAGLPIALRGGIFDAAETFIQTHNNGFVFQTIAELKSKLEDSDNMRLCRENAIQKIDTFTAENQREAILEAFGKL
ncbi:glycosyltransferase [Aquirufa sp. Wall-65K1]